MSAPRSRLVLVAVLPFAALVVGLPAGRAPLWDPNEARYTLLARDILHSGRWLIPDLRGIPYRNKPQLYFWSVAVASMPGGARATRHSADRVLRLCRRERFDPARDSGAGVP